MQHWKKEHFPGWCMWRACQRYAGKLFLVEDGYLSWKVLQLIQLLSETSKTFIFSYPYKIEKRLFLGQFFEREFLKDSCVLRSPEHKNHVFSGCFMCLSLSLLLTQLKNKSLQEIQIWYSKCPLCGILLAAFLRRLDSGSAYKDT